MNHWTDKLNLPPFRMKRSEIQRIFILSHLYEPDVHDLARLAHQAHLETNGGFNDAEPIRNRAGLPEVVR